MELNKNQSSSILSNGTLNCDSLDYTRQEKNSRRIDETVDNKTSEKEKSNFIRKKQKQKGKKLC